MSNRRIVAEAAFGLGPFNDLTSATWTSLGRIRTAAWGLGRSDEFEAYAAQTAELVIDNLERRFDPDNPSSPFVGVLLPRVPVRIRSQNVNTLVYEDEFYGYVAGGWEQVPTATTNDCRLELVDLLGALTFELPDVFDYEILSRSPVGYWVFDAGDAESVADLSGNGNDGTVVGTVSFDGPPIAPGHLTSALFEVGAEQFGRLEISRSPLLTSLLNVMVVATFKVRNASNAINWRTLIVQGDGNATQLGFQVDVDTNGEPHYVRRSAGGVTTGYQAPVNVADGQGHLIIAGSVGIGIDTATMNTTAGTTAMGSANGIGIGGYAGIQMVDHWDGWIGALAVFSGTQLIDAREAILNGYSKLDGQRADQQISWALDRVGVPAAMRNLDVGTVVMGPADTKGKDAFAWIREVVATEQGEFYVDHRDGGKLRFRHRYARHLDTRSVTSQVTFDDRNNIPATIPYSADGLDVAPNGLDSIVNTATVSWRDGEVTHTDDTSVATYGPRPRTIETQATTANQARSVAEWLVARRKDPASQVRGATSSGRVMYDRNDKLQTLKVGDRVTFRVQPGNTGTVTTFDLWVEGLSHVCQGVEWETAVRFAPADTFTPWVWGVLQWGVDNYWG